MQPQSGDLNGQIQLNFIGLSNEARDPLREWFWPVPADPHHKHVITALKNRLYEAVKMNVSILRA